jgi:dsRNA-specific ribonuclease
VRLPSPRLLLLSLTAASCHESFDLERLEFLGDVVLKVLASCCILRVSGERAWESFL